MIISRLACFMFTDCKLVTEINQHHLRPVGEKPPAMLDFPSFTCYNFQCCLFSGICISHSGLGFQRTPATQDSSVWDSKVTQPHTEPRSGESFQLTRLEKVSMPSSCVRRLDRNTPPLRDRRTPARACSSSDLICFWKTSDFKCGGFFMEKDSVEKPLAGCTGGHSEHSAVSRTDHICTARTQGCKTLCSQGLGSPSPWHTMCHISHSLSLHGTHRKARTKHPEDWNQALAGPDYTCTLRNKTH